MFESKSAPLLSRGEFLKRLARSASVAGGALAFSLLLGSVGYHLFGHLPWVDALLNAAMILTGMGPVDPMKSTGGKLFATFYALYSGVAFLTTMAVLLSPVMHRFFHKFHVEVEDDDSKEGSEE